MRIHKVMIQLRFVHYFDYKVMICFVCWLMGSVPQALDILCRAQHGGEGWSLRKRWHCIEPEWRASELREAFSERCTLYVARSLYEREGV